jgi:hypothetical protein
VEYEYDEVHLYIDCAGRYQSSLPPSAGREAEQGTIEYLSSQALLKDFDRAAEVRRLHCDHHITEFTRTLLGAEIGRRLIEARTAK